MGTYLRNGNIRAGGIGCPKPPNNGTTGDITVTTSKRISTTTTTSTTTITATPSATCSDATATAVVRFSTVETRYYPRAIGDNPTVTCGIPLTIEWDYIQDETTVTMIGDEDNDIDEVYGGDYCYDRLSGGDETKDGMGGRSGGEDEKCPLPSQHRYRRPHRHGDELVLTSMERAKILKGAGFTKEELVEALMERARIQQLHDNNDNKDDDDDTDDGYSEQDRLAWVERQRRRQLVQQQQQQQRSKQWQEQLWTWTAAIHKMKTTMKMDPFQNWMHGAWERLLRGCRHVDHDDDDDHAVGDIVVLPSSSKTSPTIPSWDRCWPHNRDRSSNDCHRRAGNQPSRATVSTVVVT